MLSEVDRTHVTGLDPLLLLSSSTDIACSNVIRLGQIAVPLLLCIAFNVSPSTFQALSIRSNSLFHTCTYRALAVLSEHVADWI